jgi:hypothetical protein
MSVRPSKKEGFDKFSQCRGNGVALYESGLIACLSDALLFSDMDGFVFSDQPIALESDFIVKILETRHYGPPIVSLLVVCCSRSIYRQYRPTVETNLSRPPSSGST